MNDATSLSSTPVSVKIDFVSDVSCPWCAIGLASLQQALANLGDKVVAEIHFQPFELNPQMAREGENSTEHLMRKYGSDAAQIDANREVIRARGETAWRVVPHGPQQPCLQHVRRTPVAALG
jgi:predicted DsbA family dithiol-disulfide isomerase